MARTERFRNLEEVRAEKRRLTALRDRHGERLEEQLLALKHRPFRAALVRNAVSDAIGDLAPAKWLASWVGSKGMASGLSLAMGSGKAGLLKRFGLFALGLAAPALLEKAGNLRFEDIARELNGSWQRLQDHLRLRQEEPVEAGETAGDN